MSAWSTRYTRVFLLRNRVGITFFLTTNSILQGWYDVRKKIAFQLTTYICSVVDRWMIKLLREKKKLSFKMKMGVSYWSLKFHTKVIYVLTSLWIKNAVFHIRPNVNKQNQPKMSEYWTETYFLVINSLFKLSFTS